VGEKPVRVFNLDAGDQISAKIVTAGPPDVLTQQQMDAILAKPAAPVAAAPAPPAEAPAASPPEMITKLGRAVAGDADCEEAGAQASPAPSQPIARKAKVTRNFIGGPGRGTWADDVGCI